MYTRHGHHIPGSPYIANAGISLARCGGPNLCADCNTDVMEWQARNGGSQELLEAPPRMAPRQDLSFLKTDERRRYICLELAIESLLNAEAIAGTNNAPSTQDIRKRAKDFEFFVANGM